MVKSHAPLQSLSLWKTLSISDRMLCRDVLSSPLSFCIDRQSYHQATPTTHRHRHTILKPVGWRDNPNVAAKLDTRACSIIQYKVGLHLKPVLWHVAHSWKNQVVKKNNSCWGCETLPLRAATRVLRFTISMHSAALPPYSNERPTIRPSGVIPEIEEKTSEFTLTTTQ